MTALCQITIQFCQMGLENNGELFLAGTQKYHWLRYEEISLRALLCFHFSYTNQQTRDLWAKLSQALRNLDEIGHNRYSVNDTEYKNILSNFHRL